VPQEKIPGRIGRCVRRWERWVRAGWPDVQVPCRFDDGMMRLGEELPGNEEAGRGTGSNLTISCDKEGRHDQGR
jgi:hypothetical protein